MRAALLAVGLLGLLASSLVPEASEADTPAAALGQHLGALLRAR